MSSLAVAFAACAVVAGACWLLSVLTRECSWTDRLWSITPIGYVAWFASRTDFADTRLLVMTVLVGAWGARLTFNFARKGGYGRGGEDYRWGVLRTRMKPWQFQLFNLGFIAGYQNLLLLLIALPAYSALGSTAPLGAVDVVATALFVLFLAGETIADNQQWAFQQRKRAAVAAGAPTAPFLTEGLFRFSRHPNFFCEQAIWWSLYLFSVGAGAGWLNPSIVGAALLTLLFAGSSRFTEEITVSRYPSYADYQRTTSRLIPWPSRSR